MARTIRIAISLASLVFVPATAIHAQQNAEPALLPNELSLTAVPAGSQVHLSWSGKVDSGVAAIEVFRGTGDDGELSLLHKVADVSTSTYTDDTTTTNTAYRYALRLRGKDDAISALGQPVAVHSGHYVRRINCGGERFVGPDGIPWEADDGRVLGTGRYTTKFTLAGVYPQMRMLYKSERWAYRGLNYKFEVDAGKYAVVLVFAETNPNYTGNGKRTFDVFVGGEKALEAVDVFSQVGANKPLHLTVHAEVKTSELVVELRKKKAGPALKGIWVEALPDL